MAKPHQTVCHLPCVCVRPPVPHVLPSQPQFPAPGDRLSCTSLVSSLFSRLTPNPCRPFLTKSGEFQHHADRGEKKPLALRGPPGPSHPINGLVNKTTLAGLA
ncbi:hypothetical protein Bbelb_101650 [Branchiostoma belcheri]|nr:hypothetical protein Bbelb_101650 [Branchiostoma belcheri]